MGDRLGGGGSRRAEEDGWVITPNARAAPTVPARTAPTATAPRAIFQSQYQYHEQQMRARNWSAIEEENVKLVRKIAEVEAELQREKTMNRKLQKNHMEELRYRDRKEMMLLFVVSVCVVMYACSALVIRAFV
ncbi:unnamed protein product [Alopecurus aequalis]